MEGRVFQTARTGQIPQNIAGVQPTPLPDAIWMAVPSIFILMNPLGTSPARDLISQICTGKVLLGTVPLLFMQTSLLYKRGRNFNPTEVPHSKFSAEIKLSHQAALGLVGFLQCILRLILLTPSHESHHHNSYPTGGERP